MTEDVDERRSATLPLLEAVHWDMNRLWHEHWPAETTAELGRDVRWLLVFSGSVEVQIPGGSPALRLQAGDAALLAPDAACSLVAVDDSELAFADLRPAGVRISATATVLRRFTADNEGVVALVRTCPVDGNCSREAACSRSSWAPSYAGLIGAATEASWGEAGGHVSATHPDPELARVLAIVSDSLDENWTVDRMARLAHLSRSSLIDRFKRATGRSPMGIVRSLRMREARGLLMDRNRAVGTVAFAVGYGSAAAFSRVFSGHHGVSPQAWRSDISRSVARKAK
jgi:AraC-like DNA-binding protein